MHGSRSLMPIIIILALSIVSTQFGFFFLSSGEVGIQPNVRIFSGEKITPVTWVESRNVRYSVWDVRKETGNALVFSIVCVPMDGTLIKDPETSARVLAVRLTLEMAKVVQWITEQSQNIDQIVSTTGNILGKAISIAEFGGQTKVARELSTLKSLYNQKAEVALAIANAVASSKNAAETLIQERSDVQAEYFLTTIATAGIAHSRATPIMLFIMGAIELVGISTAKWIDTFYDRITYGQTPLLEALAQTYGRYEINRMFQQIADRVSGNQ